MTPADPPTVFAIDDDAAVCASLQESAFRVPASHSMRERSDAEG